ncbi:double-strand break repair protein AddB [Roseomonas elaeocarpi]|uniref:Double-strand break repair protein AddB n=1 Tax=Roseomonas elaeocarpi TaxID=907779 RepID=A0ABV6JNN2_9PROT
MNLYEIPAHLPFLDALARGVVHLAGTEDPAALARTTILLPTRRAARSLRESFLRASGREALLLPRLRPLAGLSVEDAEELSLPALMDLPPAVDAARRLAVLTSLVMRLPPHFGGPSHPDQAWRLAVELSTLLDEMALEGCDPAQLPGLVPEGLAQHWQITHLFLGGVITAWNEWLAEQGLMDIGPRRVAAIEAQTAAWRDAPPCDLVVAAGIGIGGTIPSAAALLRVLARAPNGHVVLHGVGEPLPRELWDEVAGSHTHPLNGQARLLQQMDASFGDLRPWPGTAPAEAPGAPSAMAGGAAPGAALRPAADGHAEFRGATPVATSPVASGPITGGPDAPPRAGGMRRTRRAAPLTAQADLFDAAAEIAAAEAAVEQAGSRRAALLARSLRPAGGIACWGENEPARWAPALDGLTLLTAPDEAGEAAAIALLLREALETPGTQAALVTPDRDLARRVSVELARHGVMADDSAGQPLGQTPAGAFLRLLCRMVAEGFAPVPALACLKHPLCAAGLNRADWMRAVRELEREVLRGPRPAAGLAGLRAAARLALLPEDADDEPDAAEAERRARRRANRAERLARVEAMLSRLEAALGSFTALAEVARPPAALLEETLTAAEALAATDTEPGGLRLYHGEEGEPLAVHLASLGPAVDCLPPISAAAWPGLFDALLEGPLAPGVRNMRGRVGGSHPRVQILGLLEARLQSFDRVVLGALEETVWPIATDPGAWMSRPMRREFGLPEPEARIGRVAADYLLTALSAPDVVLSRARRRGGSPAVPARWLTRLETFLDGQKAEGRSLRLAVSPAAAWAARLDVPEAPVPSPRPAPNPPAILRPKRLTVTDVWTLKADPYAWYARRMLGLRALDPIDAEADGAQYGSLVHDAVAAWTRRAAGRFSDAQAEAWFREAAEEALAARAPRPGLVAFWRPRLERIGAFLLDIERAREEVAARHAEVSGTLPLSCGVELYGRADRIDRLTDGSLAIIDFKTGTPPTDAKMRDGRAPQMPLEAAMALRGAFRDGAGIAITGEGVSALEHWQLSGRWEPGARHGFDTTRRRSEDGGIDAVAEEALRQVDALAEEFLLRERPFLARPHPGRAPAGGDYDHLSRLREWGGAADGGEA